MASRMAKVEIPLRSSRKPRQYPDGPLPFKPSGRAPRNAVISHRSGSNYSLKIGDVDMGEVGVEEILDWVSALELETFENRELAEERRMIDLIDRLKREERDAKWKYGARKVKRKQVTVIEPTTSSGDNEASDEAASGRHGRKRPDYSKFYLKGSLQDTRGGSETPSGADEPPKRRRRKRDPVTGELLPLPPLEGEVKGEASKPKEGRGPGSRRRRHPITNELMPLGWKYDPNEPLPHPSTTAARRQQLPATASPEAKRVKVEVDSISSPSRFSRDDAVPKFPNFNHQQASKALQDVSSSEDETATADVRGQFGLGQKLISRTQYATSTPMDTSPEPGLSAPASSPFKLRPTQREASPGKTSMLYPSAAQPQAARDADDDAYEDDEDEDEFYVENITAHCMSDEKTHPAEFGTEPVMLYQVKWQGYDELKWEPKESFHDLDLLNDYRRRAGLPPEVRGRG